MSEYNRASVIRYYRKQRNMTQEELAEGICDTYTLSRYESGTLNPSEENYQKIMNKLEMPEETILFNLQTEDVNIAKVRNRLLWLFERGDYQGAENEIEKIISKNQLPLMYVENRQFLYRIRLVVENNSGKLDLVNYILSLEKLLKESFKDYDSEKFVNKYFYTENELLILNNIAVAYGEAGKYETACRIFSSVIQQMEKVSYMDGYKPYYLLMVNYANILGLHQQYDESIEMCRKGISWLWKWEKGNCLYNFIYNIGWNYIEKSKGFSEEEALRLRKIGLLYVWEAYELCELYPDRRENLEHIKKYFEKNKII